MTPPSPRHVSLVHGAVVLVLLALFLYTLEPVLSPIVLFLALLVLMSPYAGTHTYRLVLVTGSVLVALWLLTAMGSLLAPFVLAFVLAYVLDPLVDRLVGWRVPRSLAILLLALPGVGLLVLLIFVGIPSLADQVQSLIRRAPEAVDALVTWLENARSTLLRLDLPLVREELMIEQLRRLTPERIVEFLETRQQELAQRAWEAVLGVGRGLGTALTILGYVVLTPVLTYYLLRDYDKLIARVGSYVPRPRQASWTAFAREYDRLLSRYLRGQLLAAATVGVLTWLGLWALRFPYSGVVGAVAGVFNIVPYLGLVVSLIPALIIALLSGNIWLSLLKIAVVFGVVQALDGTVIGPRIVGGSVGLHPVWVILALAIAGLFYGFVGLLLAIPAAILLKLLLRFGLERYRGSSVYLGRTEPA